MAELRPGEHWTETRRGGEDIPANHRAYKGTWCPTCGAEPGKWCRRIKDVPGADPLRSIHNARRDRLVALDSEGWGR